MFIRKHFFPCYYSGGVAFDGFLCSGRAGHSRE